MLVFAIGIAWPVLTCRWCLFRDNDRHFGRKRDIFGPHGSSFFRGLSVGMSCRQRQRTTSDPMRPLSISLCAPFNLEGGQFGQFLGEDQETCVIVGRRDIIAASWWYSAYCMHRSKICAWLGRIVFGVVLTNCHPRAISRIFCCWKLLKNICETTAAAGWIKIHISI